jgi:lactate dehydrogenase-like 2-hydroxyacid dehydrogenase
VVTNTPDVLNAAVAELCVGALLSLLRRLPQADRHVREGRWARPTSRWPASLAGKRVGIVGLGRIGKDIARRLEPFGVALAYHGRSDQKLAWRFEPDLAALARDVDILIVAAPGGRETARMIDAPVLDALGPKGYSGERGARLAGGPGGAAGGAGGRPHRRRGARRVRQRAGHRCAFLRAGECAADMPHIGSATQETRAAMAQLMLDNLRAGSGVAGR